MTGQRWFGCSKQVICPPLFAFSLLIPPSSITCWRISTACPSPPSSILSICGCALRGGGSETEGLFWKLTSLIESNEGQKEKVSRLRHLLDEWMDPPTLSLCLRHTDKHTWDVLLGCNSPYCLQKTDLLLLIGQVMHTGRMHCFF